MAPRIRSHRVPCSCFPKKGVPSAVVGTGRRWCRDYAAGLEESSTGEIPRLQKFCRRNCWVTTIAHTTPVFLSPTCRMWWFSKILLQLRSSGRGSRWTSACDRILRISLALTIWQTQQYNRTNLACTSLNCIAASLTLASNNYSQQLLSYPAAKISSAFL